MNFVDESFENERIELHGKSFRGCKFTNCELVYDGDRSPTATGALNMPRCPVFGGCPVFG